MTPEILALFEPNRKRDLSGRDRPRTVAYNRKANRLTTFHPKTASWPGPALTLRTRLSLGRARLHIATAHTLARNWLPRPRLALSEGSMRLVWLIQHSSTNRRPDSTLHHPRWPGLPNRCIQFLACRPPGRARFRSTGGLPGADRSFWTRVPQIARVTIARAVISELFADAPMRISWLPAPGNKEFGLSSL